METNFSKQLHKQQQAYDDVSSLNVIMQQQFDATMAELSARHQTLKDMVERKASMDQSLDALAHDLSKAGAPNGAKPNNGNRIMIDVEPGEPTPRQSRLSVLRKQAVDEMARKRADIPAGSPAAAALQKMEASATDLYVRQMLLLGELEERATRRLRDLKLILASTGLSLHDLLPPAKIANTVLAEGGPFIEASNLSDPDSAFFEHANRAGLIVDELSAVEDVILHIPLSSPLTVNRRFTSGFGVRRDPFTGRMANHFGLDFAAAWASPVTATAAGVVIFTGQRTGYGNVVEISHGNGFVTRYAHLHRITVRRGQKVNIEDKVGELGSTGRSTGPHVHYEIIYKGKPRNPRRFIEAGRYVFES
ncbi:MAG: peptidoglycan DD-metalloendopeptidase family protein [Alphaproteobacteria bacterium]|nr:peptidoglycan DD-metalloendopeptidase family protein [Alphaproteobacteria bacterium]